VPAHAIAEAPRRSIDYNLKVVASLQNQHGPRSTDNGRHLAEFIATASRAVQIAHVHGNPIYPALVTIEGEFNASLKLLPKLVIPADCACSNSDFHLLPPVS
jgi:hypothetical protein